MEDEKKIRGPNMPDRIISAIGQTASWLIAVLIATILVQVILRYVFNKSFVSLEEIQWHLYAIIIMLGLSYSFVKDSHIRLDIMHSRFSRPTKEKIEIMGIICFLWPMIFVFFMHSLSFVSESFRVGERSDAPMGLGYRWAIKSIIPIAFFLLFSASVSRLIQALGYLRKNKKHNQDLKNNHGKSSNGS
ncbi:MAG: TRAP transporter small permease subunit [Desulfobacula sp.]|jgi:TRAP-type mannitol/chloroaromatic compound transport system permease small subunit|nr:TRAP transporter small permease subunit [Desulfobacula sp.]